MALIGTLLTGSLTEALLADVDLADPELYATGDPLAVFRLLREHAPVFWNRGRDGPGFWAVTRYADALTVYRDPGTFTSEHGMQVVQDEAAVRAAAGKMVIVTDGPRHRALRRIMTPRLSSRALRRLEPLMRDAVAQLLDPVRDRRTFDFAELAGRLPLLVTSALLGVPESERERVALWTKIAIGWSETDEPVPQSERARANADLFVYYAELVRERRRAPTDDLISDLVRARLGDDGVLLNVQALVNGGNETTRHAASGGVIAFVENPPEWERLRREPALIPRAVEEILRWTSPTLHQMRTATRDSTVGGARICAGERISVWNPSVNRDEAAFPHGERFDVARSPNRHLAFGAGPHVCVGAALARLELTILIEALVRRVEHIELAEPPKRLHSTLMWGFDRVPVRFELEPAA